MKTWHVVTVVAFGLIGWVTWLVWQPLMARQMAAVSEPWEQSLDDAKRAYQAGDAVRAEELSEQALSEAEKLGPEHPAVGISLHNLARLNIEKGKADVAEAMQTRAVNVLAKVWGPDSSRVALAKVALADAHTSRDRFAVAEPLYQSAAAALEKSVGPKHPMYVMSLERYAAMLRKAGRAEEAESQEARVRDIRARNAETPPAP
jgi:hypothetical protein